MKKKLRIYSDIHLDHYGNRGVDPHDGRPIMWYPPALPDDLDTTLILAGDLWVGTRFIEFGGASWISHVAKQFKEVFIVLGNHDYWPGNHSLNIVGGGDKCNAMLVDRGILNVTVLDMGCAVRDDVIFIGATLWTDMAHCDPLTMHRMDSYMAYDGKIAYSTGEGGAWSRFTSEKWIQTFYRHRDYIKMMLELNRDKKAVIITHHLPLLTLGDPMYAGDFGNPYYMSDLSDLILDNENIALWCYGHTHHQKDTMMVHARLINNCVGYQGQHMEQQGLVSHKVIEV